MGISPPAARKELPPAHDGGVQSSLATVHTHFFFFPLRPRNPLEVRA